MHLEKALTNIFEKGRIAGDQGTTVAVKFLDLSAWFEGNEPEIYVKVVCTVDAYALPVESATPTTAPSITDVTGDGAMDFLPAKIPEHFTLTKANPFLAYSADAGILRVRRASPRSP